MQNLKVDPAVVRQVAMGARQFWGEDAAKGCRRWAEGNQNPLSKAEWLAAAELIEQEDATND